jgi:hypothetical protein
MKKTNNWVKNNRHYNNLKKCREWTNFTVKLETEIDKKLVILLKYCPVLLRQVARAFIQPYKYLIRLTNRKL